MRFVRLRVVRFGRLRFGGVWSAIGMFVAPLAALLVLLALPIAPEPTPAPTPPGWAAPGWYADPAAGSRWRYWDGRAWTDHTAPMAVPG